jgi:hypothetical protein
VINIPAKAPKGVSPLLFQNALLRMRKKKAEEESGLTLNMRRSQAIDDIEHTIERMKDIENVKNKKIRVLEDEASGIRRRSISSA